MDQREEAKFQTRRRILDAAIHLHTAQGILGTTYRQIAERADVSVGTVYNHFPSVEALVPACGALLMERLVPPAPEDAAPIVRSLGSLQERFEAVGKALFSFYERGGAHLDIWPSERLLPEVQEWEDYQRATVVAFVHEAVGRRKVPPETLRVIAALFDLGSYRSLRARGVGVRSATKAVAGAATNVVNMSTSGGTPRRRRSR